MTNQIWSRSPFHNNECYIIVTVNHHSPSTIAMCLNPTIYHWPCFIQPDGWFIIDHVLWSQMDSLSLTMFYEVRWMVYHWPCFMKSDGQFIIDHVLWSQMDGLPLTMFYEVRWTVYHWTCFIQPDGRLGPCGPQRNVPESVPSRSLRPTDEGRVRASCQLHHSEPMVALETILRLYYVIQTGDQRRVPLVRVDY